MTTSDITLMISLRGWRLADTDTADATAWRRSTGDDRQHYLRLAINHRVPMRIRLMVACDVRVLPHVSFSVRPDV